ncbi:MAG TPA: threonine-phosphate decarboxylase CobD [Alphaproteobacteria bacterium]|nr:threonine-phosphate decarboxylase CobD [Alphaproteobacteria bacterium]
MADTPKPVFHGGDLAAATARFGAPADGWLDLSTGINPLPYRVPELSETAWTRLPQRDREEALIAAAYRYYRVAPKAEIVPAPGTQSIIQWLPRLLAPTRVAVHGPTYGGHAAAWSDAGHTVMHVEGDGGANAADTGPHSVAIFVNPNNPDGRIQPPEKLRAAAARCAAAGGFAVIDEAFADLVPEASLAPHADAPGVVILRSVGKFFGLPGLRVGFALGSGAPIDRLRRALGPWAVSGPALEAARAALEDDVWIAETRSRLVSLRTRLDGIVSEAGLEIVGGTDLFRLTRSAAAARLHAHLGGRGILTRNFDYDPQTIRIGLPGSDAEFARLSQALASFEPG